MSLCPQPAVPLAHVVLIQRHATGASQLQRPFLCYSAPLPHAPLRHHLHRRLQVAHEQAAGLHHVPAVLRLPGAERHAGGQGHLLSGVRLRTFRGPTPSPSSLPQSPPTQPSLCLPSLSPTLVILYPRNNRWIRRTGPERNIKKNMESPYIFSKQVVAGRGYTNKGTKLWLGWFSVGLTWVDFYLFSWFNWQVGRGLRGVVPAKYKKHYACH